MYLNESVSRYTLIGTVFGNGYDCTSNEVNMFEGQTDGIWNKVSEHMHWLEDNMRQLGEQICQA